MVMLTLTARSSRDPRGHRFDAVVAALARADGHDVSADRRALAQRGDDVEDGFGRACHFTIPSDVRRRRPAH